MANDSGSRPMYEMIFHTLRERIPNHEYRVGEGKSTAPVRKD
ncbi:hypothetical protein ACFSQ7_15785 [Paenibacillus rhizoplanae]|uniref:Uncharacterized protein n=1 Tax=Paenibacillus rhizoplanae TaxID=1917181 RepID=A0ABW5FA49_9BACL